MNENNSETPRKVIIPLKMFLKCITK